MANVLQTAGTWLGGMFRRHASGQVLYKRATAAAMVPAHQGRTQIMVDGEVVRLSAEWRDFFIDYGDLVLPAVGKTLPTEGDKIEHTEGTTVYEYEVMPLDQGSPCYDWTSAQRRRLRIHAKEIDTR